jgi:hypothetical protein
VNTSEQLNALLYRDTLHHHAISTSSKYYPIDHMVLLGLSHDTFNFGVVIQWRLIFQEHLDQVHPIVRWLLIWLIDYHQMLLDCFIDYFCWLD